MRLFSTMSGPQSRPGRFLPGWGWTILLLVLPAVLAGCHRGQPPLADTKPPEVFYTLPVSMTVTDYENYSGQTAAINSIDIRARVSGYLEEVRFQEGMNVQKGDVLFVIDPRPYKDALDQAQADSNQAEANLGVAQTSLKLAQSTLDIDLKAGKAITELQLSQDRAAVDTNQAQVKAAQATIKVKAAAAQTAQRNLDWTQVTSPVTGRIGKRNEDPGNLVMADMTVLTNIVQLDPIYVY
ncbi:MAG: efflux RND transporter periplasmic adaptor subunit, partial [Planctomycetes bacterium]|nr:efflux RND transporter periplasmic adaptor subunit [Planctomycetota bacterium]